MITKKNELKKNKKPLIVDKKVESEFNGMLDTNGSIEDATVNNDDEILNKVAATSAWNVQECETSNTDDVKNNSTLLTEKIDEMFDIMEDKMKKRVHAQISRVKRKFNIDVGKKNNNDNVSNVNESDMEELEFKNKKQKPILNKPMEEVAKSTKLLKDKDIIKLKNLAKSVDVDVSKNKDLDIDPNKYINVTPKHLNTDLPNVTTGGDDILDDSEDEEEKHNIISEAFADDDVIDEFRKEKEEEVCMKKKNEKLLGYKLYINYINKY